MKTTKRLIEFVLHGDSDKFKRVLGEEITNRITDLMKEVYVAEANALLQLPPVLDCPEKPQPIQENTVEFYPEKLYELKDGNIGILDKKEQELISKLYENLNNDNKERMVKLLSESKESFNRVLKLAKLEETKRTNK